MNRAEKKYGMNSNESRICEKKKQLKSIDASERTVIDGNAGCFIMRADVI